MKKKKMYFCFQADGINWKLLIWQTDINFQDVNKTGFWVGGE